MSEQQARLADAAHWQRGDLIRNVNYGDPAPLVDWVAVDSHRKWHYATRKTALASFYPQVVVLVATIRNYWPAEECERVGASK